MEKNQRQKLYDWVQRNKDNEGKCYKTIFVTQHDYDLIRVRLRNGYPYSDWNFRRISNNKIELAVFIRKHQAVSDPKSRSS